MLHTLLQLLRLRLIGIARLMQPAARGVYHPHAGSAVLLGIVLAPDADCAAIERRLWWRGLGIVERDGLLIAGADISVAVRQRRAQIARRWVTRQLRDAGLRGPVRRWPDASRARTERSAKNTKGHEA